MYPVLATLAFVFSLPGFLILIAKLNKYSLHISGRPYRNNLNSFVLIWGTSLFLQLICLLSLIALVTGMAQLGSGLFLIACGNAGIDWSGTVAMLTSLIGVPALILVFIGTRHGERVLEELLTVLGGRPVLPAGASSDPHDLELAGGNHEGNVE